VAEVEIYAYSAYFTRDRDLGLVPLVCNDYCNCVGKRCGWIYRIPCVQDGKTPQQCPNRRLLAEEKPLLEESLVEQTAEEPEPETNFECRSVWAYDRSNAWCLGHLQEGTPGWTNKMVLPSQPISLDLHAKQDGYRDVGFPVGKVYVSYKNGKMLANYTVDKGFEIRQTNMHAERRRLPKRRINGVKQEVFDPRLFPWGTANIRTTSDVFTVDVNQERAYVAGHAIVCGDFRAKEEEINEAVSVYESSLVCLDQIEVANENFENNLGNGWSHGVLSYDTSVNEHFLELLNTAPDMYKDFTIPEGAEDVIIHFTVLQFGKWNPDDQFYFKLWSAIHPVPLDHAPLSKSTPQSSHGTVASESFTLTFPRAILRDGVKLQLGFGVNWAKHSQTVDTEKKRVGISSLIVTALGQICHSEPVVPSAAYGFAKSKRSQSKWRLTDLRQETSVDANESEKNNKAGRFCQQEEFPCDTALQANEGPSFRGLGLTTRVATGLSESREKLTKTKRMVQVCRYSRIQGYKSYCIPEHDSDIIQFHSNDYCGPCTGGFETTASKRLRSDKKTKKEI